MSARSTSAVKDDCTRMVAALRNTLASVAHENDISAPNDRERIWQTRQTLTGIIGSLTKPFEDQLVRIDARLAECNSNDREVAELEQERDAIIAQVEASLEYAKQFIPVRSEHGVNPQGLASL